MRYNNYHRHCHKGNFRSLDCVVKFEDYCKRAVELGHTHVFTTQHGYIGDIHESNTLSKKYNLNMVTGVEAYYVPDRFEKDRSNYHIMIIALNRDGFKQINCIMSEANKTGFYYKPRIDDELLFSLNPDNVVITTACVGGILRKNFENREELLVKLKNHFGRNLYLEVQSHVDEVQAKHNEYMLSLSQKFDIELIHGNDSHYIKKDDSVYRDMFLKAKGINYEDESGFILDYADSNEIIERYKSQGVLTQEQVRKALENTLVFDKCESIGLDYEIKLPKVSDNSEKEFKQLITDAWIKERQFIPKSRWKEYLEAIRYESDIVLKTNMQDYFILDYKVVKLAVEKYGGVITRTGRGSAPSFYINKLLGLTDIDRLDCPITLYPTRFISTARIMETKSLPDIDLNLADRTPFIKATEEILGQDGIHWLVAFKPLQDSSAFRLWCKAKGLHVDEYNEIAKNLDDYVEDKRWKQLIEESKIFKGVVEGVSPSPCSFLLLDKNISEEVGIMRVGDEYCANLDGYNCDVYKYLKNDYLSVKVWKIIAETCGLAKIKIPTIRELRQLLDDETYKLYEEGLTCTLNQADSQFATDLVKRFKPKSEGEMSAFVASIRPGFASLLENFIERNSYTTGVPELDELFSESYKYLLYQEVIMKFLVWLGMEESQTYDIIKKISKKKFDGQELIDLKETLKQGWVKNLGYEEHFDKTWQVIEDAANYSFNASHSLSVGLDSLYGAYLKSHYPLEYYSVCFNNYQDDLVRTTRLTEELDYFKIKLCPAKFGYSKADYFFDKKTNTIYKGVSSVKFLNEEVGNTLYELSKKQYDNFVDLLSDLTFINSRQLEILIKIGYFSSFGKTKFLLDIVDIYKNYFGKKVFKNDNYLAEIIKMFAKKVTEKQIREVDTLALCKYLVENLENVDLPVNELIRAEYEFTGTVNTIDETVDKKRAVVLTLNTKYTPIVNLYQVCSGKTIETRIETKYLNSNHIEEFDIITITNTKKKQRKKKVDGQWITLDEYYYFIEYEK